MRVPCCRPRAARQENGQRGIEENGGRTVYFPPPAAIATLHVFVYLENCNDFFARLELLTRVWGSELTGCGLLLCGAGVWSTRLTAGRGETVVREKKSCTGGDYRQGTAKNFSK